MFFEISKVISWSVYDNNSDQVIGVWDTYEQAITFCYENRSEGDLWEVFPYDELLLPAAY